MQMQPVKSSNIDGAAYDPMTQDFYIEFKSGTLYAHHRVPQSVVNGFWAADSQGKYYAAHVRGIYKHTQLRSKRARVQEAA